jgi:hypothetical protein
VCKCESVAKAARDYCLVISMSTAAAAAAAAVVVVVGNAVPQVLDGTSLLNWKQAQRIQKATVLR